MSLSSSGESVAALLGESLGRLSLHHPDGYRRFVESLGTECVLIALPPERFLILVDGDRARIAHDSVATPTVEVVTERRTVDDVIEGRLSLVEAIELSRLHITGSIESVAVIYDALITYVFAMADMPAHVDLIDRFRSR